MTTNPCLTCRYKAQGNRSECLATDLSECAWSERPAEFPVVTKRTLPKICYMVTRSVTSQAIPLEESFPPPGKTIEWLLARLPVLEVDTTGQRTRRVISTFLLAERLRVVDLSLYPVEERVVRDGVVLREGTTVYEAVVCLTRVPLERVLSILQIIKTNSGYRGTVYRLPSYQTSKAIEEELHHA